MSYIPKKKKKKQREKRRKRRGGKEEEWRDDPLNIASLLPPQICVLGQAGRGRLQLILGLTL